MIFSFLFTLSFSVLYLISAIFAEIPQRGKSRTLYYTNGILIGGVWNLNESRLLRIF